MVKAILRRNSGNFEKLSECVNFRLETVVHLEVCLLEVLFMIKSCKV